MSEAQVSTVFLVVIIGSSCGAANFGSLKFGDRAVEQVGLDAGLGGEVVCHVNVPILRLRPRPRPTVLYTTLCTMPS